MNEKLTVFKTGTKLKAIQNATLSQWRLVAALFFSIFTFSQVNAQIVINEIKANGMTEIANLGNTTVDISDYYFSSFPYSSRLGDLGLVCGDLELEPGELVTVNTFDNVDFREGELALYTEKDFQNPDAIIDYVQWGKPNHTRERIAVEAGIWIANTFLPRFEYSESIAFDGCNGDSTDGYSIGSHTILCEANGCTANGGQLTGGPYTFDEIGDGTPDMIPAGSIGLSGEDGCSTAWVVTDSDGNILGLPGMPSDVDFDAAGAGVCLVWHVGYTGAINGLTLGANANDIEGNCFSLSNPVEVIRNNASGCNANGGTITGGPFTFDEIGDGTPDMIPAGSITSANKNGENFAWVVTDNDGNILGLPAMPSDVDFDGAGAGTCLIWCLAYDGDITGAEVGSNANDIEGCFSLSNPIEVIRNNASGCNANGGTITGGPFTFDEVGDGTPDMIPAGSITSANKNGENFAWVVTDSDGNILGLPTLPSDVDFDGAGAGTCLIWCLAYDGNITGAEVGANANDLEGCFSLSNPIEVIRNNATGCNANGGTITGGPFTFDEIGDGTPDMIPAGSITSANKNGENFAWVVTDSDGNILGLPTLPSDVDFDGAGPGTCLIWCLAYDDNISGAEVGENANDLEGCFSLSNPIEVIRNNASGCNAEGGTITGGPFTFDQVGDGTPDMIPAGSITSENKFGENSAWVVTDTDGNILGLPASPSDVDFDVAGAGTCLIWCLAYDGDITGAEVGLNANDIEGCFSLSNPIEVIRISAMTPGVDITLDIEVDNTTSTQYTNSTYTMTVCNEGTETATNIAVMAPFPNGMVYVGHTTSAGEYELAWMKWDIPSLAPGECATLELTLFSLVSNQDVNYFVQVVMMDQTDIDSTPDNSTGQVNEDDEASVVVTITSPSGSRIESRSLDTEKVQIHELSPNPVTDFTRLPINSDTELQTDIFISDISGKLINTRSINIIKGYNELNINTSSLSPGVYIISFSNDELKTVSKKFIKTAN